MSRSGGFVRRDDGQMGTALSLFLAIGMIFVAIRMILPVGEAADKRSQVQVAADAAALAAVDAMAADLLSRWRSTGISLGNWNAHYVRYSCGPGNGAAGDYAGKNGGHVSLVHDCVSATGEYDVSVELDKPTADGRYAVGRARASFGLNLAGCNWVTDPAPVPTTTTTTTTTAGTTTTTAPPPPTTTTPPQPPPDRNARITCAGGLTLRFVRDGHTGHYDWASGNPSNGQIKDAMRIRLTR